MAEWEGFLYETPFLSLVAVKSGRHVQGLERRAELPAGAQQRGSEGSGVGGSGSLGSAIGTRREEAAQLWIQLYCI